MSLSTVETQLRQWADSAALKATRANDPDTISAMEKAAHEFRSLLAAVQGAAEELAAARRQLAAVPAAKAPTVRRMAGIGAFSFWRLHGRAVEAITAVYGLSWKVRSPFGETILATVPPGWRSAKTERGQTIHWSKDHRMPAARYWPDGRLPAALALSEDYPRAGLDDKPYDARWHREHGYLWDGHVPAWRFEIEVRAERDRAYHEATTRPELMAAE